MLCCGTLALAASLVVAVGRRAAMVILVGAAVLIDPSPLLEHAVRFCGGA
jgi:hypothetical protein